MLAVGGGHQIELICFEFNNWSKVNNDSLIKCLSNVKIIKIEAGRKHFFKWGWSMFTEKFYRFAGLYLPIRETVLSQAISRRSNLLIQELNKVSKPDWV